VDTDISEVQSSESIRRLSAYHFNLANGGACSSELWVPALETATIQKAIILHFSLSPFFFVSFLFSGMASQHSGWSGS
jgi:hypothetical protein